MWWMVGVLLLMGSPVWGAGCGEFPSGSLSQVECERVQAQELAPKRPANDSVFLWVVGQAAYVQDPEEYYASPGRYAGEQVTLRPVWFRKALGVGVASFSTRSGKELLVKGIPLQEVLKTGWRYTIMVVPVGMTKGENALGGPVVVSYSQFVSAYPW